ncbi:hypothetical protein ES703_124469 [subsurface metagenome]
MEMEASTALTRFPSLKTTSSPESSSAATQAKGVGRASICSSAKTSFKKIDIPCPPKKLLPVKEGVKYFNIRILPMSNTRSFIYPGVKPAAKRAPIMEPIEQPETWDISIPCSFNQVRIPI